MTLGPLHLTPLTVPKPWGGRRLARYGQHLPPGERIGESWLVADLPAAATAVPDPVTRVAAGTYENATLTDVIATNRAELLGAAADDEGRFPLLVKLLDAREPLSIQVHPPAVTPRHPRSRPKAESWVIVEADPGAQLMIGLAEGVTLEQVERAAGTPQIVPLLARREAIAGDIHHVPAGTVHALGAGVLVAEVQTPSDSTHRLYDWTNELRRAPRHLDIEVALAAVAAAWPGNLAPPPAVRGDASAMVDTPHYRLRRLEIAPGAQQPSPAGVLRVLVVLDGELHGEGFAWALERGGCVVLPAACATTLTTRSLTTVLEVALP